MSTNEDPLAGLPEEDEEILAVLAELFEAERTGTAALAEIRLGPFTAFNLIGIVQLAWRHPDLTPFQREACEGIGRSLQLLFGPPLDEVLTAGWDVDQDVAR